MNPNFPDGLLEEAVNPESAKDCVRYQQNGAYAGAQDGDDGVAHWCLDLADRQAIERCWI